MPFAAGLHEMYFPCAHSVAKRDEVINAPIVPTWDTLARGENRERFESVISSAVNVVSIESSSIGKASELSIS